LRKNEAALKARGVTVDAGLVARVLDEVKRVREERAETGYAAELVDRYYSNMNRLGLTEDDVLRIAEGIGTPGRPRSTATT
jgi:hypothetical protein